MNYLRLSTLYAAALISAGDVFPDKTNLVPDTGTSDYTPSTLNKKQRAKRYKRNRIQKQSRRINRKTA